MNPLLKRLVAALGAGAFGQAVNIVIQLLSLPLFLKQWSTATYGTWLLLSAMPAYLSMADIGMVATAGNRMTMAMGQGDKGSANAIFQSALVFMLATCLGLGLLFVPLTLVLPLPFLPTWDERLAVAALICGVLLSLFGGLCDAMFRATGRYALGTMLGNLIRLGEWGGYMAGLFAFGTFSGVAACGLGVRLVGVLLLVLMSAAGGHGLKWHWRQAQMAEIRTMVKPAVSFMVFPLSNALSFQGITLLVGHLFGPAVVAIFNTYRTLARVAVQVTGIFGHALWAEFSRLFGQGGAPAVRSLYRRSMALGIALSVGLSLVLYVVGPWLLELWTHGAIQFQSWFMLIMLFYAAIGGIWHVPRVLLLSTNQHIGLAQWCLATALLALGLAWVLGRQANVVGVGLGMLLSEVTIASMCLVMASRLISATTTRDTPQSP